MEAVKLGTMAGLNTTLRLRRPELRAIVDRPRAAELGVQQIGGIAVDGLTLAVSDTLTGNVVLLSFAHEAAP